VAPGTALIVLSKPAAQPHLYLHGGLSFHSGDPALAATLLAAHVPLIRLQGRDPAIHFVDDDAIALPTRVVKPAGSTALHLMGGGLHLGAIDVRAACSSGQPSQLASLRALAQHGGATSAPPSDGTGLLFADEPAAIIFADIDGTHEVVLLLNRSHEGIVQVSVHGGSLVQDGDDLGNCL